MRGGCEAADGYKTKTHKNAKPQKKRILRWHLGSSVRNGWGLRAGASKDGCTGGSTEAFLCEFVVQIRHDYTHREREKTCECMCVYTERDNRERDKHTHNTQTHTNRQYTNTQTHTRHSYLSGWIQQGLVFHAVFHSASLFLSLCSPERERKIKEIMSVCVWEKERQHCLTDTHTTKAHTPRHTHSLSHPHTHTHTLTHSLTLSQTHTPSHTQSTKKHSHTRFCFSCSYFNFHPSVSAVCSPH